ncbi:(2Fe-2S)-binding protein [Paenibacillus sp. Marseille-P2973]|uniref:(2Fe-2S)-binding protein n=1 Tax=unclassified Paenibacillus TaxID=185978 RepID=UPI001B384BFF|nr:(2Fe-2S)-binding protein [Paenibacillus sp. Marseille-P2973]MBQ4900112.1 (2Fe-2S)-binding protein [Paenibacillus sp. Marseille-P2973]
MDIDFGLLDRALSIVTEERADALFTIPAERLPDREQAERLLEVYREQIKGKDIQVAATYYAACWRVVPAALLYMVAGCDGGVDFSLKNLTIQIGIVNDYPRFFFVIKDSAKNAWPTGDISEWREEVLGAFIRDTLRPVMETASAISGLPVAQLWGQMPLGVEFYLDYLGKQMGDPSVTEPFKEQYAFFSRVLDAQWFGLKRNPFDLKETWIEDPYRPGEMTRMKPTCCLAYRTDSGHGYCYGCPKLSKADREAKRKELVAAMAAKEKAT